MASATPREKCSGSVMMSKKVLIVEDNELNMKLFHDLLDAQGYATLETREGLQALTLARQHRPALNQMDIQQPEISRLEVTKWLKDDDDLSHIPGIAVTAFAMKGDEERIREGGCEAYLSKPISVGLFIETVRRFVGFGFMECPRGFWSSMTSRQTSSCSKRGCRRNTSMSSPPVAGRRRWRSASARNATSYCST